MSLLRIRQLAPTLRRACWTSIVIEPPAAQSVGVSGRVYEFEESLEIRFPAGQVWAARAGDKRYVLKELPESWRWENFLENIWPSLDKHPNIRLPCDTILGQRTLVYEHLSHDYLDLAQELPAPAQRQVLKSILQGLAELHSRRVAHLDVKPNNVMVDCSFENGSPTVQKVQVIDFEDGALLKPGKYVAERFCGNENWRSPEQAFRGYLYAPTDMFSFGITCIYGMLRRIIFWRDEDLERHKALGNTDQLARLTRQVMYFGDAKGLKGLRRFAAGKDKMAIRKSLDAIWKDRKNSELPYKHFSLWPEIEDKGFKDVVLKMMNLDPEKRLTAREALEHPWFADVKPL
ncbi:kinase domain-containing protein [Neohortaea acidophila]|uniref:Kinase domain-containing protein n=1 Tax=Neohortaea acidophila TaxID=245834 RepID=A0A6A6Q4A3_9PEZI|nr:kinase domain-containing protein [Neohortaea acidophila]KAF2486786.1 kinase domain-containing protein [Neohortaea acidophila]